MNAMDKQRHHLHLMQVSIDTMTEIIDAHTDKEMGLNTVSDYNSLLSSLIERALLLERISPSRVKERMRNEAVQALRDLGITAYVTADKVYVDVNRKDSDITEEVVISSEEIEYRSELYRQQKEETKGT